MRKRFLSMINCTRVTKDGQPKERKRSADPITLGRQDISLERPAQMKTSEIYGHCQKGMGEDKIECQDSCTILENIKNQIHYVGVYDGHGPRGRDVSSFINQQIETCLKTNGANVENALSLGCLDTFIRTMIKNSENKLASSFVDAKTSGTCFLGVFIAYGRYFVANIGDSRAVLCKQSKTNIVSVIELSRDHKPVLDDEKNRITSLGGIIAPTAYMDGEPISPLRVWSANRDRGLTMTRAIGNLEGKPMGLISDPEIRQYNVEQDDKFIIVASDGIWDMMTSAEACSFVINYLEAGNPKSESARALAKEAQDRWANLEEYRDDPYSDDITAIISYMNN